MACTCITFYSFKGGVGRSMAVANVARLLRERLPEGGRILVIDWDLEAPGLHRYFPNYELEENDRPGLVEYFSKLSFDIGTEEGLARELNREDGHIVLSERYPLQPFLHMDAAPGIDLLKAGRLDAAYRQAAANLNWYELLTRCPGVIDAFRRSIARMGYRYCMVDSRTGLSDASGICTALMPDKLVAMYTPNRQNLDGLKLMVRRAVEDRREANDLRPLAVFPVASRIENSEGDLKAVWTLTFLDAFEDLFSKLYGEKFDLAKYFEDVRLPYVSQYAYGERVAVVEEERSDAFSLRRAYEVLTGYLEREGAWPEPEE